MGLSAALRLSTLESSRITGNTVWRIRGEKTGTSAALSVKANLQGNMKWIDISASVSRAPINKKLLHQQQLHCNSPQL
jgi:hypothetical protein